MDRFEVGQAISRFRISRLLGKGGFGEAYLALDARLDRQVVLKCPRADLDTLLEGRSDLILEVQNRFWVEARAQARVCHPNACSVYEVDESAKILVIEYVEGRTLEELRTNQRFSRQEIIDIAIAVADTIVLAHTRKVLHRDLSLRNIMLTASNQVKVLDFGLARLTDQIPFTHYARILGTPLYMSPEQELPNGKVDERSDVFSLGVVVYKLVTGQFPYLRTFTEEPEPSQPFPFDSYGVEAWPALNSVVLTALQPKRDDRYPAMRDMLDELVKVRSALNRLEHPLYFFDTSTLLEIVCPGEPTPGENPAKRARDQFEVHHADHSAVSSTTVFVELVEQLLELYFQTEERGLNSDVVRNAVAAAKRDLLSARRREHRGGALSWEGLSPKQRVEFLRGVKNLFIEKLHAIASQLSPVHVDLSLYFPRLMEFAAELQIPERDARVFADALSLRSEWLFSENTHYQGPLYSPVIRNVNANLYSFTVSEGTSGSGGPPDLPAGFETATEEL